MRRVCGPRCARSGCRAGIIPHDVAASSQFSLGIPAPATCRGGRRARARGRCWSRDHAAADPSEPHPACPPGLAQPGGSPSALAPTPARRAVRQWGRLGYPRRALRLHEAATIITRDHTGEVPSSHEALLALPGIGRYTAAAVAVFAFGDRHAVLDTNVRRVLARLASGEEFPGRQPSTAEYRLAESLLPEDPATAARWSVAVMELGALTCTAARPKCGTCPVSTHCKWLANGSPPAATRPAGQRYEGTDRQCRGRLLALLRESPAPVSPERFDLVWPDTPQRARALDGLVADGLVDPLPNGTFALPALCHMNAFLKIMGR
jgi:A/G-specific adenine glycosylase